MRPLEHGRIARRWLSDDAMTELGLVTLEQIAAPYLADQPVSVRSAPFNRAVYAQSYFAPVLAEAGPPPPAPFFDAVAPARIDRKHPTASFAPSYFAPVAPVPAAVPFSDAVMPAVMRRPWSAALYARSLFAPDLTAPTHIPSVSLPAVMRRPWSAALYARSHFGVENIPAAPGGPPDFGTWSFPDQIPTVEVVDADRYRNQHAWGVLTPPPVPVPAHAWGWEHQRPIAEIQDPNVYDVALFWSTHTPPPVPVPIQSWRTETPNPSIEVRDTNLYDAAWRGVWYVPPALDAIAGDVSVRRLVSGDVASSRNVLGTVDVTRVLFAEVER